MTKSSHLYRLEVPSINIKMSLLAYTLLLFPSPISWGYAPLVPLVHSGSKHSHLHDFPRVFTSGNRQGVYAHIMSVFCPICPMYVNIYSYIYHKFMVNVGKYSILLEHLGIYYHDISRFSSIYRSRKNKKKPLRSGRIWPLRVQKPGKFGNLKVEGDKRWWELTDVWGP